MPPGMVHMPHTVVHVHMPHVMHVHMPHVMHVHMPQTVVHVHMPDMMPVRMPHEMPLRMPRTRRMGQSNRHGNRKQRCGGSLQHTFPP